jgi:hypothetical protein
MTETSSQSDEIPQVFDSANVDACKDQLALAVQRAAVLFDDVLNTRKPEHLTDRDSLNFYEFYNSKWVKWSLRCFVAVDLALAMFEEPTAAFSLTLPPLVTIPIELLCLTIFAVQGIMKYRFLLRGRFVGDKKNVAHVAVIALQLVDIAVFVILSFVGLPRVRWSRFMRVWFVTYTNKTIRLALRDIRKTMLSVLDVLLLELLWVAFFAVLCTLMFSELDDAAFSSMTTSFVSLYQLLTLVNFPVRCSAVCARRVNVDLGRHDANVQDFDGVDSAFCGLHHCRSLPAHELGVGRRLQQLQATPES